MLPYFGGGLLTTTTIVEGFLRPVADGTEGDDKPSVTLVVNQSGNVIVGDGS
jgi:hypothetical protein